MTVPRPRSTRSVAITAVSVGLVAGLALGITGFATAASPSPQPVPLEKQLAMHMRGERLGMGGLVSAISPTSLTVRTPMGARTIGVTSSTVYDRAGTKVSQSAITVGEVVRVRLVDPRATSLVAAVVTVVPAGISGWVTSVSGDTITLTDQSGFTRTVKTSSATKYVNSGAAATSTIVKVGAFLRAAGQVDPDGTTLDATRIAVGFPKPPADAPGFGRDFKRQFAPGFAPGGPGFAPGGPGFAPGMRPATDPAADAGFPAA